MNQIPAKPTSHSILPAAAVAEFQSEFGGAIIRSGSAEYENARKVWNAIIDRYPAIIAMCEDVEDVVKAVRFARDHHLPLSVRSGGHNVAGRALCDDGIVVDLSRMKAITVDADRNIVEVQGGATLGELDAATSACELAVPTGVAPPTGVAGLALGGGVGWLTRKYGMTCDNLVGCDVVTADGTVLTADRTQNPDLFWGLRGGGGNFGIVTTFRFQAHPIKTVLGGLILYPRDQTKEVLRFYRDFMKSAPNELTAYAGLMSAPDGTPVFGIMACYCGHIESGRNVLGPLQAFGSPIIDMIQPIPFIEMQKLAYQPAETPTNNYWRSACLDELSDAAIDVLIQHANAARSPLTGTFIQYFGGAAASPPEGGTAFAQRGERYNICIEAQWLEPQENDDHIHWARSFSEALAPFSQPGNLLNFMNDEGDNAVQKSFGENYQRLRDLKTKYDPTNFFRHNQNILPAAAAE